MSSLRWSRARPWRLEERCQDISSLESWVQSVCWSWCGWVLLYYAKTHQWIVYCGVTSLCRSNTAAETLATREAHHTIRISDLSPHSCCWIASLSTRNDSALESGAPRRLLVPSRFGKSFAKSSLCANRQRSYLSWKAANNQSSVIMNHESRTQSSIIILCMRFSLANCLRLSDNIFCKYTSNKRTDLLAKYY